MSGADPKPEEPGSQEGDGAKPASSKFNVTALVQHAVEKDDERRYGLLKEEPNFVVHGKELRVRWGTPVPPCCWMRWLLRTAWCWVFLFFVKRQCFFADTCFIRTLYFAAWFCVCSCLRGPCFA